MDRFAELVARARALTAGGERRAVLGIAGAPGAGKTTLALAVVRALAADPPAGMDAGWVTHVPMDGYHLADVELDRLGRRDRKGAPDTFDPAGYAALLRRLRAGCDTGPVYAPAFDREIEQPVAGSIPVRPGCRLVVSEGNYLLVDTPEWCAVRAEFDEVWFHETDEELRRERLVARHVRFGKTPEHARAWVRDTDEPNARLVAATRYRADVVVACAEIPG
ncbi:nucleoside/nucleotide kinase family protein [Pseudonocardia sp. C8]|uniref:nucleoside/nucleotide kinase family protein n=1 Tax=Pseudonocardia sp. C8 TaxID=2762759 RepID=UPI00351C1839